MKLDRRVWLVVTLTLAGRTAWADSTWFVEASIGQGVQLKPRSLQTQATSLLAAPGYSLTPALRATVGLVAGIDATREGDLTLEVRPALAFVPSGVPWWGRITAGVVDLTHDPAPAFGASFGARARVSGLELFFELGFLPRQGESARGNPVLKWVLEARAGGQFDL